MAWPVARASGMALVTPDKELLKDILINNLLQL